MRYFLDTEFIEDGKTIDLISIGIMCEDGRSYYAISSEFSIEKALENGFVRDNVLPHVCVWTHNHEDNDGIEILPYAVKREEIACDIARFVMHDRSVEFWADYGAYDWVAVCQLYGAMMFLPHWFPNYCNDIQQLAAEFPGYTLPSNSPDTAHNALEDAKECKERYEYLKRLQAMR